MTLDPAVVVAAIGALASGFGVSVRLIYNDLQKQVAKAEAEADWWRDKFLLSVANTDAAIEKVTGA